MFIRTSLHTLVCMLIMPTSALPMAEQSASRVANPRLCMYPTHQPHIGQAVILESTAECRETFPRRPGMFVDEQPSSRALGKPTIATPTRSGDDDPLVAGHWQWQSSMGDFARTAALASPLPGLAARLAALASPRPRNQTCPASPAMTATTQGPAQCKLSVKGYDVDGRIPGPREPIARHAQLERCRAASHRLCLCSVEPTGLEDPNPTGLIDPVCMQAICTQTRAAVGGDAFSYRPLGTNPPQQEGVVCSSTFAAMDRGSLMCSSTFAAMDRGSLMCSSTFAAMDRGSSFLSLMDRTPRVLFLTSFIIFLSSCGTGTSIPLFILSQLPLARAAPVPNAHEGMNRYLTPHGMGMDHHLLSWLALLAGATMVATAMLRRSMEEHERPTQGNRRRRIVASSAPDGPTAAGSSADHADGQSRKEAEPLPTGVYHSRGAFQAHLPLSRASVREGKERYLGTFTTADEARSAIEESMAGHGLPYLATTDMVARQQGLLGRGHVAEQQHLIRSAVEFARAGYRTMAVGDVLLHLSTRCSTGFAGVNDRRDSKGQENRINQRFRVSGGRKDKAMFFDNALDAATYYASALSATDPASTSLAYAPLKAAWRRSSEPAECIYDPIALGQEMMDGDEDPEGSTRVAGQLLPGDRNELEWDSTSSAVLASPSLPTLEGVLADALGPANALARSREMDDDDSEISDEDFSSNLFSLLTGTDFPFTELPRLGEPARALSGARDTPTPPAEIEVRAPNSLPPSPPPPSPPAAHARRVGGTAISWMLRPLLLLALTTPAMCGGYAAEQMSPDGALPIQLLKTLGALLAAFGATRVAQALHQLNGDGWHAPSGDKAASAAAVASAAAEAIAAAWRRHRTRSVARSAVSIAASTPPWAAAGYSTRCSFLAKLMAVTSPGLSTDAKKTAGELQQHAASSVITSAWRSHRASTQEGEKRTRSRDETCALDALMPEGAAESRTSSCDKTCAPDASMTEGAATDPHTGDSRAPDASMTEGAATDPHTGDSRTEAVDCALSLLFHDEAGRETGRIGKVTSIASKMYENLLLPLPPVTEASTPCAPAVAPAPPVGEAPPSAPSSPPGTDSPPDDNGPSLRGHISAADGRAATVAFAAELADALTAMEAVKSGATSLGPRQTKRSAAHAAEGQARAAAGRLLGAVRVHSWMVLNFLYVLRKRALESPRAVARRAREASRAHVRELRSSRPRPMIRFDVGMRSGELTYRDERGTVTSSHPAAFADDLVAVGHTLTADGSTAPPLWPAMESDVRLCPDISGAMCYYDESSGIASWDAPTGSSALPDSPLSPASRLLAKDAVAVYDAVFKEAPPRYPPGLGFNSLRGTSWFPLFEDASHRVLLYHLETGCTRAAPWISLRTQWGCIYFANLITGQTRWLPPRRWMEGWISRPLADDDGRAVGALLEGTRYGRELLPASVARKRVEGGAPYLWETGMPSYAPDRHDTSLTHPHALMLVSSA